MIKNLKNKKGISTIIASILMVVIVLVATGVIYGVVSNLIFDNTKKAEKCGSDIIDKITINKAYTCHNNDILMNNPYDIIKSGTSVSVNVKDITIDKLLIVINYKGESKTLELVDGVVTQYVKNLGVSTLIKLPKKNEGKTYILDTENIFYTLTPNDIPDSIAIIPVIGGEQCGVSDQLNEIPTCKELFG